MFFVEVFSKAALRFLRTQISFAVLSVMVVACLTQAHAQISRVSAFGDGSGNLSAKWETFSFSKSHGKPATQYRLERDAVKGETVIGTANASASALMHRVNQVAARAPTLRWSWKISQAPTGADASRKEGDDYAARLYVGFAYDPETAPTLLRLQYGVIKALFGEYPPHSALTYIVEPNLPEGTVVSSPFTSRVKMIVVDSGQTLGQWRSFSRNIVDDYKRAFGVTPPTPIAGIAIMTDADNTQSKAQASYATVELIARE